MSSNTWVLGHLISNDLSDKNDIEFLWHGSVG